MLYPLKLEPLFKQRLWGGNKLSGMLGLALPPGPPIGELWAVADHPAGQSLVANGPLAGVSLGEITALYPQELLGKESSPGRFPLLIKLLDAGASLSVQVHPDDLFAAEHEQDDGKTEMWYILQAGPQAEIVHGLKPGATAGRLLRSLRTGTAEKFLNRVKAKAGDVFFIPAGLVHALGEDILAAEVQQNSDITYRMYDYGRVDVNGMPRELHIAKALSVVNCRLHPGSGGLRLPFRCDKFTVDLLTVDNCTVCHKLTQGLEIYLVLQGCGQILTRPKLELTPGDAMVLPACLKTVMLKGDIRILRTHLSPCR